MRKNRAEIMENRTYYGEYSLGYWLHLICNRNIVLPPYQRHFVWSKEKVLALLHALKEGRFVPPITIGAFRKETEVTNYVIDGQQRLTSLLLAYIGKYPCLDKFDTKGINLANDAMIDEDSEGDGVDYSKEWTFNEILSEGKNSKSDILLRCSREQYEDIEESFSEKDLGEIFIGFSYIVPGSREPKAQQAFYTREFMDLNTSGTTLNALESRRSLYFWDSTLTEFFEPEFARFVILRAAHKSSKSACLDFVRYLALMADYAKSKNSDSVANGWKKNLEGYYFDYICSIVENKSSKMFLDFNLIFIKRQYKDRMDVLKKAVADLKFMREHQSIIELDIEFFGLVYWVLYQGKRIRDIDVGELNSKLGQKIKAFRNDVVHAKAPGLLKYLRSRIKASCEIYGKYVI